MSATTACLTGGSIYRLCESGHIGGARKLPRRETPFGPSEHIFLMETAPVPFYIMPRYGAEPRRLCPSTVNYRANLYALKDIGVQQVISWSAAGAITHDYSIGQIVLPDDVIDMTRIRPGSFFSDDMGFVRQFPVFCPALRSALETELKDMNLPYHAGGTVAVMEGPRLETPAEVRMLGAVGAEMVTHTLAPDVFLAKELQMCFAGACYLVNYAETGSRHRPLSTGELFDGLTEASTAHRIALIFNALPELILRLAKRCADAPKLCDCAASMARNAAAADLDPDWRTWFKT
jgi:5'-methylthioadenosine phosphorylase